MNRFPPAASWRAACASDPVLAVWAGAWSISFGIESDGGSVAFDFVDGRVMSGDGPPTFTLAAPAPGE